MELFQAVITAKTASQLRALKKFKLDLKDHTAYQREDTFEYEVIGFLSDEQKQQIESAGYGVDIISNLNQAAEERLHEVSRVNRFIEARTLSEIGERAVQNYMTADEVESALINLHNLHPDIVTIIELPNKTWGNRTSRAVRLHAGTNNSNSVGVMFTGSMHAREWGGSDICVNFITNLLHAYSASSALTYGGKTFDAEQVKTILENIHVFVFPDVNPDGKVYSQATDNPDAPDNPQLETVWWRKNRNPNPVPGGPYPMHNTGVDLNRNFDFLWESGIGTDVENGNPVPVTYRGSTAFSEPETKNVKSLLDTFNEICFFVDIHCYAGLILFSWGDDDTQCIYPQQNFRNPRYDGKRGVLCGDTSPDIYREYMDTFELHTLVTLARRMNDALTAVRGRRYKVEPAVGLYPTSATSQDYAFSHRLSDESKGKVYAFTIEFGSSERGDPGNTFIPPYSEMRKIIDDVCAAMTELCLAVSSKDSMLLRDKPL
jgi:carboxypeptidase T